MEQQFSAEDTFYIEIPGVELLLKSEGEGSEGRRCVEGYASTEDLDQDREQVLQAGLDFSYLQKSGYLNYDHQYMTINGAKVPIIVGYPTLVEMRDRGLWTEGELLKGDPRASEQIRLSNELWELGQALKKSGSNRRLAFSVEGGVIERRGKKIVRSIARHLAITHKPVNTSCSIETFAKSLCCGKCSPHHPEFNPAHRCGNKHVEIPDGLPQLTKGLEKAASTVSHGALLRENLDRGISTVLYGDKECGCYQPDSGRFEKGLHGAHGHMVGCMGYSAQESIKFLREIIGGAGKSADLAALAKTAGLIRQ